MTTRIPVVTVDHEDESLGVLEVVPPQRPDLVLAAHVPHREADVLVLNSLHVKTCKDRGASMSRQVTSES